MLIVVCTVRQGDYEDKHIFQEARSIKPAHIKISMPNGLTNGYVLRNSVEKHLSMLLAEIGVV